MVVDRLEFASKYYNLGPGIEAGLKFLAENDLNSLEPGRYDIQGDDVYALVLSYETKPKSQGAWEAHRRYTDIQYVFSGDELMGCTDITTLSETTAYDEAKDIVFLEGDGAFVWVAPGTFAIFTPEVAHMPGIEMEGPDQVRKVVVKVRV